MTVTISLDENQENRLRNAARVRGVDADTLVHQAVQKLLDEYQVGSLQSTNLILGLHKGRGWISDDFDDPLSDSFWLGEE